jgi:L-2-hydroxyglutarate oxidase LhgO
MVHKIGDDFQPLPSGIRAQLLNKKTNELVMDFLIEHKNNTTHVLNAVSPAFTCSFAFAKNVVDEIEQHRRVSDE